MDNDSTSAPSPRRRRNRQGKLRRGEWYVSRIRFRDPATGESRQEYRQFVNKEDRDRYYTERLHAKMSGTFIPASRLTVGEMMEQWLQALRVRERARDQTVDEYERYVRRDLIPEIGAVRLNQPLQIVTAVEAMVQRWKRRSPMGTLRSTHYHALDVLRMAFHWATVERELIPRNPLKRTALPKPKPKPSVDSPWDLETIRLFLAEARRNPRYNRHYLIYEVALWCGLREGEILGLEWPHVDLRPGAETISIRQTYTRKGKRHVFNPPKTAAGRRPFPLESPELVEGLRALRITQDQAKRELGQGYGIPGHDLVFCHPNGKPIDGRAFLRRQFYGVCKAAGVPQVTFHHLRHLWATYFKRAGGDAKDLMTLIGHTTTDMTMKVYEHPVEDSKRAALRRLDALLRGRDDDDGPK